MIRNKGFTLIELLAVILILGIISLIAIPTVNNILNESRKGSFETTTQQVSSVVEQNCQIQTIKGNEITKKITFSNGVSSTNLDLKGKTPDIGYLNVSDDCSVTYALADTRFCTIKDDPNGKQKTGDMKNGKCIIDDEEVQLDQSTPKDCFEFDSSTGTITDYFCGRTTSKETISGKYYKDVVVPETIDGVTVKAISSSAFGISYVNDNYFNIDSIVLPNTVTDINSIAFEGNEVSYIKLGNNVKKIGSDSLYTAKNVTVEIDNLTNTINRDNYPGLLSVKDSCLSEDDNLFKIIYKGSNFNALKSAIENEVIYRNNEGLPVNNYTYNGNEILGVSNHDYNNCPK